MSNLLKRVLIGAIGIPFIILICYLGGIIFLIFASILTLLGLWELYSLFEQKDFFPLKFFGIFCSLIILFLHYFTQWDFIFFSYSLIILFLTIEIFRRNKKNPLNPIIIIFGFLYITVPFIMLNELLNISKLNIVIYIFILIWTCDTTAYFGGRFFGKHQLSSISPKKTWEGSIIGLIFTVAISLILYFIFPDKINLNDALIVGIIIGIFSQVGDLFESLIKRYCNVKDSSNIIPGHGGILDRFDSLIFVTPLIFIYFRYIK